ncbi:helicase with zinc finger domain 2 [Arapaima gigas]
MEQPTSILKDLLQKCSLKIACSVCTKKESNISYSLITVYHQCNGNILLGKAKDGTKNWKHISRRPKFPNPSQYAVCFFFKEGYGCVKHRNRCTFARSAEEVLVWNFQKRHHIDHVTLMRLVADRETFVAKQKNAADHILTEFAGEFQELCELCFHSGPQRIATKRWNKTCSSESAHPWRPILVHYLTDGHNKKVYNEIRRPPARGVFQYCSYVARGMPCWHGLSTCQYAHSEVEMAVWKAEVQGEWDRSQLVSLSQKRLLTAASSPAETSSKEQFYCKACLLTVSSKESFLRHCNSLEHTVMISRDITTEWKHRLPPQKHITELQLCDRPDTCDYGDNCVRAHSEEELEEWLMRYKETEETRQSIKAEGLMSYRDRLLQEYRSTSNEVHVISDYVDDVTVIPDRSLSVECEETGTKLKWNFLLKTERSLAHVALLKDEPGALFTLGEDITDDLCTYARGERFTSSEMSFEIPVCFEAVNPGLYVQWLVFDFNMRPVLLQKLQVTVGEQKSSKPEEMPEKVRPPAQGLDRWHRGNKIIIPYLEKKEADEELQKEYKPPTMNVEFSAGAEDRSPITAKNYRKAMHNFLYKEELAQEEVVSRLSLQSTVSLSDKICEDSFGYKFAPGEELFAAVPVFYSLTLDSPEGFVLRRAVTSALVAPLSGSSQQQVYEAGILRDANSENKVYLQLSKRCCSNLNLQNNTTCNMEVQFQLNRLHFCEMHKAVDLLPKAEIVLPDLNHCCVPVHNGEFPRLNVKQQAAMSFILGDSDGKETVAPLLIYGPFGTGKTFTLATAVKELVRQPGTRVLICTHTNSSADLYVKDHFHQYVEAGHHEAKPLRIKANKKGVSVGATDGVTLRYCHRSNDGQSFMFPNTSTIDKFKVVITTVTMARQFHDLKLPPGYFTHILIDEASQMLECEALMPLSLAGKGTRIVLAGDHMQMCPKLFSVKDEQRSGCTLLNRLFRYYLDHKSFPALKSRIIFNENYRSTKEIVDFVSTNFYVGKNDAIKASGKVSPHPKYYPLRFHHVRGQCCLDPTTMSWFNYEEVKSVVQIVENLLKDWPTEWGNQEQRTICVLSEGCQVFLIRKELRKRNFSRVTVENLENVQGKQFRILVMTTVHTRDSLLSLDTTCLDFFNDARVLNTAMTRAQSQVIVVGDAAALCVFGKCPKIWKNYIEQCIIKNSAHPSHLSVDYIEQEMMEISQFQKPINMDDDDSDFPVVENNEDEILQHLIEGDTTENCAPLVGDSDNSDEMKTFFEQHRSSHSNSEAEGLISMVRQYPGLFKHGELVLEKFNAGYVIPFDNPVAHITVKGKENLGMSFPGDEVVVEIIAKENGDCFGKILGVTKKSESPQVFVCTLEDNYKPKQKMPEKKQKTPSSESKFERKLMVPIKNNVTKIQILVSNKFLNSIPVYKSDNGHWNIVRFHRLSEEVKRKHVFLVEVVCWRDDYWYPLGYVTDVLPIGTTMDEALKILDAEFNVFSPSRNVLAAAETCAVNQMDDENRTDLRDLITFTVDPEHSKDLDDAISVKDLGSHYELGVHIADVASIITKDSVLDKYAKKNGATYYRPNKEPVHMFPQSISIHTCSLLPGLDRKAISLMVTFEKATHRIVDRKFVLSQVRSDKRLSYEEAEDIIEHSQDDLGCQTVEDCVAIAYRFSRAHRKARLLEDWCYSQPDDLRFPGKRKSHQMIEELMVMFNNLVSDFLIQRNETNHCTPLRCQAKPKHDDVKAFKNKYRDIIPMSTHLTYHIGAPKQQLGDEGFSVLTSLWKELQCAAESMEFDKITDLVATDDIHPQLLPATSEFRRNLLGKSYVIRANSAPEAKVGHYSLQLDSYTQASSPIRRYLDVILQRLLHAVLRCMPVQYSPPEIDMLCQQFDNNNKKASEYQKKAETLSFCINLKRQNTQKAAFVIDVNPEGESFKISFPFCSDLPSSLPVMYRDLQLEDQPLFDEKNEHMKLTWKRRMYSMDNTSMYQALKQVHRFSPCISVPQKTWQNLVEAVRKEDWNSAISVIKNTKTKHKKDRLETGNDQSKHYIDLTLNLKCGDTVEVQMTTETKQGFLTPTVQLLNINPRFEVCLDHSHNPTLCFCKYAERAAKNLYANVDEYIKIWRPLCEMESATTAVDESDSITIEDMTLIWKKDRRWEGSFILPGDLVKEWAIECNLGRCFLCIRKRNLEQACAPDQCEITVDPKNFTWVAHGVTTKSRELKKSSIQSKEVEFYINHMPMENIPDCVLQEKIEFTVEIIPKLLPDIRKESAINSLKSANDLVQSIAVGKKLPRTGKRSIPKWRIVRAEPPQGLPHLNESQFTAIMKALESNFTLIQGPPGTGKTVVGAYIVYWFLVLNSENPRYFEDPKEKEKKEVILYCGPSNKSVDVTAEYLMKFKDKLRLLRVYSRQMEMLEYPYPGSIIQLSRKSLRQERSKPELRSVTLHHRIREKENPCSGEILAFDQRIRNGDKLTDHEVEEYKKLLNKARLHELRKHDVILCTCTASSTPNITKSVSARQILIDECAMATEPQALVPLVSHNPEKIVLLGDHKQLRPIVKNELVRNLGMSKSLFERYSERTERTVMLDTQYRMHKEICGFPSMEYYNGKLKTAVDRPNSVLKVNSQKSSHIVFGHICGTELSLVVSTEKGNENSKANREEQNEAVRIALLLVNESKVHQENIAILSPYNAQVSELKRRLKVNKMDKITVCTITKSQGSEWRYVILSTVRSLPSNEIEKEPTKRWLSKNVGFVSDPNQINVAITRAQVGLCILGNEELLRCSPTWQKLLAHYTTKSCVTEANNITVHRVT